MPIGMAKNLKLRDSKTQPSLKVSDLICFFSTLVEQKNLSAKYNMKIQPAYLKNDIKAGDLKNSSHMLLQ